MDVPFNLTACHHNRCHFVPLFKDMMAFQINLQMDCDAHQNRMGNIYFLLFTTGKIKDQLLTHNRAVYRSMRSIKLQAPKSSKCVSNYYCKVN